MEDVLENGASVRRLNTKGCCFLCLRIENMTRTVVDNLDKVAKYCSMRQLLRHLQINENFVSSDTWPHVEGELIEVNLCKTCREINGKVAKICLKLEVLQLELNYMLECIHTRVTDSAKDSDRVQNYSRRMTSDFEALSQLAFVDKLRKELATKCLRMRNGPIPIIQVTKYKKSNKSAVIKQEQSPFEDDPDVEMSVDPPFSPSFPDYADSEPSPSSPIPGEIKFSVIPLPEVLDPKTSSSSAKHTLDARPSSGTESTSKNNAPKNKQSRSNTRRLQQQDVFCLENEATGMFHCKQCSGSFKSLGGLRWHYRTVHLHLKKKCQICEKMMEPSNFRRHERACRKNPQRHLAWRLANQNDPNDSEPSPSFSTEEIKFNANPAPEQSERKPSTSLCASKETLNASCSSETQSTSKNNKKKQTRAYSRHPPLPQDVYCLKNETTGMFHCKKCNGSYKCLAGVRWHYKTTHLHLKQKCNLCQSMLHPTNIRRHERACRKNPQRYIDKQNNAKFGCICKHCGKQFDTRKKRCDHELHVHRYANRFPCHLCDKKFNAQTALKIHVDRVHLRKRNSCRFCNLSLASSYQTKRHEKICMRESKIKVEPEVN